VSVDELNVALLLTTTVLLVAIAAVRLSSQAGLPTLLLYLGIGLIVGEAGFGLEFEDAQLTQVVGLVFLAIILAEGGLTTRWSVVRPVLGPSLALATVGVAVSVAVTATVAIVAFDVDLRTAILLGAVVSSTDAAAVFSVLRRLPLRRRLGATLEAESGFNDPPVIILVTLVVSDAWEELDPLAAVAMTAYQLLAGAVVGLLVARIGQFVLARSALPSPGLYPVATVAIALLAFAAAGVVGGSSFMAIYVAGLWLGNAPLPHRHATLGFAEGLAWLSQIGLFVLLGLLASPSRLPEALPRALVIGAGLLLLARPLSVLVSTTPFRVPWREQAFMSWAGLRGAVPIVLATIPLSVGVPAAQQIFDVVFLLVVVFTLIQAPTLPPLARLLDVVEKDDTAEVDIESAPLDQIRGTLLQFRVPPRSRLAGVSVLELRLPTEAAVTLILRGRRTIVPDEKTTLAAGDHLLLVTSSRARSLAERRLRAVSRRGRLAGWMGEHGDEEVAALPGVRQAVRVRRRLADRVRSATGRLRRRRPS
jgi:potassium/hydrogen antiporter